MTQQLWIGGKFVPGASDGTIEVLNPYTEEVIDTVPAGMTPKAFSLEDPQRITAFLEEAGLGGNDDASLRSISGPELAAGQVCGPETSTDAARYV